MSVAPALRYAYLGGAFLLLAAIPAGIHVAVVGVINEDYDRLIAGNVIYAVGAAGVWLSERPRFASLAGPNGTPLTLIAGFVRAMIARVFRPAGMSPADHAVWSRASSLREVGDLVAMWLLGKLESQPGYHGPVDVDEPNAPGLLDALVALNRAGFVTNSSQAGADEVDGDGQHWQQYAAVTGFAPPEVQAWLRDALAGIPELVIVQCVDQSRLDWREIDPVTFCNGRPVTDFGRRFPDTEIADDWAGYGICQPEAVEELIAADQLVIRDTEFGRNDRLWPALLAAALMHQPRR